MPIARGEKMVRLVPRALQLELRPLRALPDLVVGDAEPSLGRDVFRIAQGRNLALSIFRQFARSRGVVTVTINDHVYLKEPDTCSWLFAILSRRRNPLYDMGIQL